MWPPPIWARLRRSCLSSPWGKILRMTADGKVPADNPFLNTPGAFPYVYALGIRAPLGLAFDRNGELWEAEDGPRGADELNHIRAGHNYGWPVTTWGLRYDAIPMPANPEQEGMEQPVVGWTPSPAISSLAFYSGNAFPRWKDNVLVGSLKQMDLFRVVLDGDRPVVQETILHGVDRHSRCAGRAGRLRLCFDRRRAAAAHGSGSFRAGRKPGGRAEALTP